MGVPFRSATSNTVSISTSTSQPVISGTTAHASLLIKQPSAAPPQYNIPQYIVPTK